MRNRTWSFWIGILMLLGFLSGCTRQIRQERITQKKIGSFRLTVYWLAREDWYRGTKKTPLYQKKKRVAWVSEGFARAVRMQGSGRLRNGWIVQYRGRCRRRGRFCLRVKVIDGRRYPMGMGAAKVPLRPFRSVAMDVRRFPFGTSLYIPELGRLIRKSGWSHNGCFVVHDRGGRVKGLRIDLFAGNRALFRRHLRRRLPRRVRVYAGRARCGSRVARR